MDGSIFVCNELNYLRLVQLLDVYIFVALTSVLFVSVIASSYPTNSSAPMYGNGDVATKAVYDFAVLSKDCIFQIFFFCVAFVRISCSVVFLCLLWSLV